MATSGSIDFIVTTSDIITEALELLGVLGEGESPTTAQTTSSQRTLNMMTKTWQAEGLNLFAVQRNFLFLDKTVVEYPLSATSTANFATSFEETTTSAAASATDVLIVVEDASLINNGDRIGIFTINSTLFWTTVNGAPIGNNVTITDALPFDVDTSAVVYTYTTSANRPMLILEAYNHQFGATDIPLDLIGRVDYYELTNKTTSGFINQVYYDPQIGTGTLFVWPRPEDERDYLILLTQRTLEDFDSSTDNPDYPQEWYMPLAYNLARFLSPKYGIPQMDYSRLMQQARELYETARGFDAQMGTSMYIRPDTWGNDLP